MVKVSTKKSTKVATKAAESSPVKPFRKYYEASGGRKTAVARIRIYTGNPELKFEVNGKDYSQYFSLEHNRVSAFAPIKALNLLNGKFLIDARVHGGGLTGQAEAIRHALARALIKLNPIYKKPLKNLGFLTRDTRVVERKKYGLKKARRAPQWAKR